MSCFAINHHVTQTSRFALLLAKFLHMACVSKTAFVSHHQQAAASDELESKL